MRGTTAQGHIMTSTYGSNWTCTRLQSMYMKQHTVFYTFSVFFSHKHVYMHVRISEYGIYMCMYRHPPIQRTSFGVILLYCSG